MHEVRPEKLNDKAKKSFEYLKNCLNDEYNYKNATRKKDKQAIETLLTAYENQQKEIQDLIINQCIYQDTSSCTRSISLKMYTELNNMNIYLDCEDKEMYNLVMKNLNKEIGDK